MSKETLAMSFALLSIVVLSACSTMEAHLIDDDFIHPYVGTKKAVKNAVKALSQYDYYGEAGIRALDIPLCVVADTVLLPYDIVSASITYQAAQTE